jgi:hypothetical protein
MCAQLDQHPWTQKINQEHAKRYMLDPSGRIIRSKGVYKANRIIERIEAGHKFFPFRPRVHLKHPAVRPQDTAHPHIQAGILSSRPNFHTIKNGICREVRRLTIILRCCHQGNPTIPVTKRIADFSFCLAKMCSSANALRICGLSSPYPHFVCCIVVVCRGIRRENTVGQGTQEPERSEAKVFVTQGQQLHQY